MTGEMGAGPFETVKRAREPLGRRVVAAVARPFGRVPKPPRRRALRYAHWAFCAARVLLGLRGALPLGAVTSRCPAPGEGLVGCQLQKSVLPAVIEVVGALLAGHLLFVFAFEWLPARVRDHR